MKVEESTQNEPTGDRSSLVETRDKNPTKARRKKRRPESKTKSNKKHPVDMEWNPNADKFNTNAECEVDTISRDTRDKSLTGNSRDVQQNKDTTKACDEKNEANRTLLLPSPASTDGSSGQRSSKKEKDRSRKKEEKAYLSNECNVENGGRWISDDVEIRKDKYEGKETNRNRRRSQENDGRSKDSTSRSQRVSDRRKVADRPPSKPKNRTSAMIQQEENHISADNVDDTEPAKSKRKTRMSPENDEEEDDDDEIGLGSFHTLRIDSDKPRSRSSNGRRRNRTPTSGRQSRRRTKDQNRDCPDEVTPEQIMEFLNDAGKTTEVNLKDDDSISRESARATRGRRKDRDRLSSNGGVPDSEQAEFSISNSNRTGKSLSSSKRSGVRRSHSERWKTAVENVGDGLGDHESIKRRAQESLNRANEGLTRSAHGRIRRHHSAGLTKLTGSLSSRSYHGKESDRRSSSDGRRTPRRASRRHRKVDSAGSFADDATESVGLKSIEDIEEFERDAYGMDLQTPGMIDFEEEMLDLMQRANPEVTDHLDRRVHRKREMVAFDRNMPMMTRQALNTRQASSHLQRQFLDGSNIDKNRLVLRNDSTSSTDGLTSSNHRSVRSAHGRRAPPRSRSSGLGGMGGMGYTESLQSESGDRRRSFRSKASPGGQSASFNQYYQNKPNKLRSLSRRASGDLIRPHSMSGSRSSDYMGRRRGLRRTSSPSSVSSRRRSASSDNIAPRMPKRKSSKERNRRKSDDEYSLDSDRDFDISSENGSVGLSRKKSLKYVAAPDNQKKSSSYGIMTGYDTVDKNDMSSKRNRSKLHLLMYNTKMCVDMDDLFRTVREGETPRSPIHSLRMPSP